jgi:hypothetical protein
MSYPQQHWISSANSWHASHSEGGGAPTAPMGFPEQPLAAHGNDQSEQRQRDPAPCERTHAGKCLRAAASSARLHATSAAPSFSSTDLAAPQDLATTSAPYILHGKKQNQERERKTAWLLSAWQVKDTPLPFVSSRTLCLCYTKTQRMNSDKQYVCLC